MLPLSYILASLWSWFLNTGINLIIIVIIGMLIPRLGRLIMRIVRHRIEDDTDEESGKNKLAFAGVGLYIVQIVAFFILIVAFLQQLGFSLAGAAIPATVASAAVGFGAQSIIADFLAGFFILTEKQFGVGDWVRFEGGGVEVEGTVVEVTMRATTIRTISHQTIIIPNSAAKVCINNSKEWSRAVVAIPVPMLGSEDINDVIARSENATRRALKEDDVAAVVIGELDVHPAVDIQPPTVVGMPWLVTMRFMVQVTAGNQWLVERAVRTQIIDEFWNEYGSATTVSGALVDKLAVDDHPVDIPTKSYSRKPVFDVPVDALPSRELDDDTPTPSELPSAETAEITADGEVRPTPEGTHPNRPDVSMSVPPKEDQTDETRVMSVTAKDEDDDHIGLFRADAHKKWWQKAFSLGGRTRMSTGGLILALLLLLVAKVFTVEPAEGWEEWNTSNNEVITTPVEEPVEPSPEPVISEEPLLSSEPLAPTTEPTVTTEPAPTDQDSPTTTAGTTATDAPTTTTPNNPATTPATTPTAPLTPTEPAVTVEEQPAPAG
ncbi:putative MscS family protein YkuT [Corynebacterium faecale]|uniref:mechanosensitive ion channel family protein n=1 Tax=Corynebacterium faecale TaxID=1758466 RepID=UPI0025B4C693|nr:mechanosensitive ion channel domain-containing protein [Corynebacterium faecale]WJY92045.1 putative MscS family protein YkuT [Corynebacterium faecale]